MCTVHACVSMHACVRVLTFCLSVMICVHNYIQTVPDSSILQSLYIKGEKLHSRTFIIGV